MFVGRWFPHPEDERPVLTLVLAPSILGGKGLPKHLSAFVGLLNEDSLVRAEDLTGNTFVDDMNLSLVSYTSHDSDCLTHLHNIPISHDNKTHAAINASFISISPNLSSKFRSDMRTAIVVPLLRMRQTVVSPHTFFLLSPLFLVKMLCHCVKGQSTRTTTEISPVI